MSDCPGDSRAIDWNNELIKQKKISNHRSLLHIGDFVHYGDSVANLNICIYSSELFRDFENFYEPWDTYKNVQCFCSFLTYLELVYLFLAN